MWGKITKVQQWQANVPPSINNKNTVIYFLFFWRLVQWLWCWPVDQCLGHLYFGVSFFFSNMYSLSFIHRVWYFLSIVSCMIILIWFDLVFVQNFTGRDCAQLWFAMQVAVNLFLLLLLLFYVEEFNKRRNNDASYSAPSFVRRGSEYSHQFFSVCETRSKNFVFFFVFEITSVLIIYSSKCGEKYISMCSTLNCTSTECREYWSHTS